MSTDGEQSQPKPACPKFSAVNLRLDVEGGIPSDKTMWWCTCGLGKKQPWCDGSHRGTPFKPMAWKAPQTRQTLFSICACKYTRSPPYCDGTHMNLPMDLKEQQAKCPNAVEVHPKVQGKEEKLCSGCGYTGEDLF